MTIVYLIRGRMLIASLIRRRTESLSVFFDIDVKGREKGVVWMLQLEVEEE